jgi:hypothetical protein
MPGLALHYENISNFSNLFIYGLSFEFIQDGL